MIKVLIADNHRIARRGIRRILESVNDISVVGEANNNQQVLDTVRKHPIDVLLLDVNMPNGQCLDILGELHQQKPKIKVLVLNMYSDREYIARALNSHAYGYLTKDSDPEELVLAVRTVVRGEKYITPALAAGPESAALPAHEALSARENQILRKLAAGKTPTEIAKELSISIKTVSTYRRRVMAKLQLKNTAEIIRYAIKYGLIE
jgi:DNA-binding NarL/FixJ family response regulator